MRGKLVFVSINLIGGSPSRGGISDMTRRFMNRASVNAPRLTCTTLHAVPHRATYGSVWQCRATHSSVWQFPCLPPEATNGPPDVRTYQPPLERRSESILGPIGLISAPLGPWGMARRAPRAIGQGFWRDSGYIIA